KSTPANHASRRALHVGDKTVIWITMHCDRPFRFGVEGDLTNSLVRLLQFRRRKPSLFCQNEERRFCRISNHNLLAIETIHVRVVAKSTNADSQLELIIDCTNGVTIGPKLSTRSVPTTCDFDLSIL